MNNYLLTWVGSLAVRTVRGKGDWEVTSEQSAAEGFASRIVSWLAKADQKHGVPMGQVGIVRAWPQRYPRTRRHEANHQARVIARAEEVAAALEEAKKRGGFG